MGDRSRAASALGKWTSRRMVRSLWIIKIEQPKDAKSLAECLDVRKGQMEDWLNRAVKEGKVSKTTKPVAYIANKKPALLSLLDKAE